jgi:hypothetical protein
MATPTELIEALERLRNVMIEHPSRMETNRRDKSR